MENDQFNNPENWKWGILYFNPDDPRYIVPKRVRSLGWTFNFAHKRIYIALLLIICILFISNLLLNRYG